MGRTSDAKERLLDAALELIWERSYGVVTIDAICEKAQVKKGSFYYFFDSKSALAVAALDDNWQNSSKAKWDAIFSASTPPLDRIRNFMQSVYEGQADVVKQYGRVLGCPCFSVGSETSTQDEAINAKAQELLRIQMRYLESAVRDAQADGLLPASVNPTVKAKCLFALFEGSLAQARIQNDLEILRSLPDAAMDLVGAPRFEPVS
jgi:TetR/AcrR family transcriptional regulator, transcriptional repressor for nem operon